mgnify:CR=1 FL=1
MASEKPIYHYPLWLRIWHGINALGIIILIVTGVSMQYSGSSFLVVDFGTAVRLHNIAGLTVTLSYMLFFLGNIFTSNGRFYNFKTKGMARDLMRQAEYYLSGMFRKETTPFPVTRKRKFNPLQKVAYLTVMYLFVPLVIASGIALLFPEIIIEEVYTFSGIMLTAAVHSIAGFIISLFLFIHIYVSSIGKSPVNNYKSMVTGWHT